MEVKIRDRDKGRERKIQRVKGKWCREDFFWEGERGRV